MQIAITGIGLVSTLGIGVENNRQNLLAGHSGLRSPEILHTSHHEWPIGEVRYTNEELSAIAGTSTRNLSRNILLGIIALRETIESAHLDVPMLANTPLVNGTTVGGMDLTEQHYAQWQAGDYSHIDLLMQHEADSTTSILCEHFGLQNSFTISTACSSALNAVIHGAGLLRSGVAKQVIVGGTEAMTLFHLNGFASLGILSSSICRPFQDNRDGINLGEGAAYLVLEDAEQAQRRGVTVYGYLAGYANRCDAYHQTASSPEGDGAYDAMLSALDMAHIAPDSIDYVNAHGTATQNNDASELCALKRLFGHPITPAQGKPFLESTKPLTGHTTSASGSIEAIFTLLRMQNSNYSYAISNAFGFGGNDSSIVLSSMGVELPLMEEEKALSQSNLFVSRGEYDYKDVISPMQARRMTLLTRQLLVAAKKALQDAGINQPDGIVVGTRWGGMIPTMSLLNQLTDVGEQDFSPAMFMNSTHNSAAGTLARFFHCKGYNSTVVSSNCFEDAMSDAKLQLLNEHGKYILVCSIDEVDDQWDKLLHAADIPNENKVQARVIWYD